MAERVMEKCRDGRLIADWTTYRLPYWTSSLRSCPSGLRGGANWLDSIMNDCPVLGSFVYRRPLQRKDVISTYFKTTRLKHRIEINLSITLKAQGSKSSFHGVGRESTSARPWGYHTSIFLVLSVYSKMS